MMSILWLSLWLVLMIDRWVLACDMMSCDCHYDWQMSTVIWCPYYDCHCDCPHDWQVSTDMMSILWLSLWLSPWLTNEHCDMSILWLSLWFVPMSDRWLLWHDVHIMIVIVICPHDWQMSTACDMTGLSQLTEGSLSSLIQHLATISQQLSYVSSEALISSIVKQKVGWNQLCVWIPYVNRQSMI